MGTFYADGGWRVISPWWKKVKVICFLIIRVIGNLPGIIILQFYQLGYISSFKVLNKKQYLPLKDTLLTTPEVGFYYDWGKISINRFLTSKILNTTIIHLFSSFSGHRPAKRECTRTGLRSHARCHPCSIQQPVKVGHTTGVYDPYSFRRVMWVLLRPLRTNQWKCCETPPLYLSVKIRTYAYVGLCI